MSTRSTGAEAEAYAERYLIAQGWKILGRNLHYRFGEIDILAQDKEWMVIIEIKAKRTVMQGYAVEMLTPRKQRVLRQLAKIVAAEYNKPVRIDVITLDNWASHDPELTHYPFAVGEN